MPFSDVVVRALGEGASSCKASSAKPPVNRDFGEAYFRYRLFPGAARFIFPNILMLLSFRFCVIFFVSCLFANLKTFLHSTCRQGVGRIFIGRRDYYTPVRRFSKYIFASICVGAEIKKDEPRPYLTGDHLPAFCMEIHGGYRVFECAERSFNSPSERDISYSPYPCSGE